MTKEQKPQPWLSWAIELQALAQNGLAYTTNPFDRERFERIRQISVEMLSQQTMLPLDKVTDLFCCERGYQTPKLDTRAAVFREGKILLVQENDGLWSLPGGWTDVMESVKSNTEKEAREEAGALVEAKRILAVLDRRKHNPRPSAFGIIKIFVECDLISQNFQPNLETLQADFFAQDDLPPLAVSKVTPDQIDLCFQAHSQEFWQTVFD
ncbi:MAG: NUDIX hydrolase [Eubacteriales bacterium]|nr:NUDIX hydrolase [Clostridiales bacterium]MDY5835975.1 NUDIX hydrolase [Eubacteriales bacterium]